MVNKNKTEDNFLTASKVPLAFCDLKEEKSGTTRTKMRQFWQFYSGRETTKPLKG